MTSRATPARLPLTTSEAQLQHEMVLYAKPRRWLMYHPVVSSPRPGRYITAGTTFLDWVLAREGVVLFVELKSHTGKATPGQLEWLAAAGAHGRLWSPALWPQMLIELR